MYLMGDIELCIGISRGQRDDVRKEQGESEHGVSVEWVQGPALRRPYEWVWTLICRQRGAKKVWNYGCPAWLLFRCYGEPLRGWD